MKEVHTYEEGFMDRRVFMAVNRVYGREPHVLGFLVRVQPYDLELILQNTQSLSVVGLELIRMTLNKAKRQWN